MIEEYLVTAIVVGERSEDRCDAGGQVVEDDRRIFGDSVCGW